MWHHVVCNVESLTPTKIQRHNKRSKHDKQMYDYDKNTSVWDVARYLFLSVSDIPGLKAVVVTEIPKLVKNEQRILRNRCPGLRTGSQYAIKRCRINI